MEVNFVPLLQEREEEIERLKIQLAQLQKEKEAEGLTLQVPNIRRVQESTGSAVSGRELFLLLSLNILSYR